MTNGVNNIKVEVFIGWGVAVDIKVEVVGIPVGWVVIALAYYCFSKVPFIIYTLINLDSVSPYLLSANWIISLLHSVWSSSCTISCRDWGSVLPYL